MNPNILVLPRRRVKQNAVFRKIQGVRQLRGRGFSARIFWDPKTAAFPLELDDGEVSWHREKNHQTTHKARTKIRKKWVK